MSWSNSTGAWPRRRERPSSSSTTDDRRSRSQVVLGRDLDAAPAVERLLLARAVEQLGQAVDASDRSLRREGASVSDEQPVKSVTAERENSGRTLRQLW